MVRALSTSFCATILLSTWVPPVVGFGLDARITTELYSGGTTVTVPASTFPPSPAARAVTATSRDWQLIVGGFPLRMATGRKTLSPVTNWMPFPVRTTVAAGIV